MNDYEMKELQSLIAERSGIHFRPGDREKFASAIDARLQELGIPDAATYHQRLAAAPRDDAEWQHLTAHLVPGESYFFRDTGQIDLMQKTLLPALIAARRASGDLRLRIWSAGCSTGEEPYSLAALVYDLLPDLQDWRLLILGTDPNPDAIKRARTGRYTEWSFRQVSPERRARFFESAGGTHTVLPEIRSMVRLRVHDLHADPFPEPAGQVPNEIHEAREVPEAREVDQAIRDMDLIVCRNVFIYLKAPVIAEIVRRIENTLTVGGMLVTGHGELSEARPSRLVTRVHPASIIYEKTAAALNLEAGSVPQETVPAPPARSPAAPELDVLAPSPAAPESPGAAVSDAVGSAAPLTPEAGEPRIGSSPSHQHDAAESLEPARVDSLDEAREHLRAGRYEQAVELLNRYRGRHPGDADSGYLLARAHANLGRNEAAGLLLQEILKTDPFGVRGYFLLAQISEAGGDPLRAMDLLKRSIYVDAEYIPGYLELGLLYDREGDADRARRMLSSALDLLKGLAPETEIEEYNGQTAAHLIARVEASLP